MSVLEVLDTNSMASYSNRSAKTWLLLILFLLALSACGGGGSSSSGATTSPPVVEGQLEFEITFPIAGSSLEGVEQTTVSGTIASTNDDALTIEDVEHFQVNGAPVTVDAQTGRWHAGLPLTVTDSLQIRATLKSSAGQELEKSIAVANEPVQGVYKLVNLDADGGSALVYGTGQLRRVDLVSGAETILYEGMVNGDLEPATGIRVDPTGSSAYFLRWAPYVWSSDAFVVDMDASTGHAFGELPLIEPYIYMGFDHDPVNSQLVFSYLAKDLDEIFNDRCFLMSVPILATERELIVETSEVSVIPGSPDVPFCAGTVVVDNANNLVIVSADGTAGPEWWFPPEEDYGLYAYDLATGVGSVLSPASEEFGPSLYTPRWMFLREGGTHVITVDDDMVMEIDLESGERSVVLDDISLPEDATDVDYDEVGNRLLIAQGMNELTYLDLSSGDYQELLRVAPGNPVGTGPALPQNWAGPPILDQERNHLFIFPRQVGEIYQIDLATLERSVTALEAPLETSWHRAAVVDTETGYLYFEGGHGGPGGDIWRIDPESGASVLVTSNETHSGILLNHIVGLSIDNQRGLLYASGAIAHASSKTGLVAIDMNSGTRRLVAEVPRGEKNYPPALQKNIYNAENDSVIATTSNDGLVQIDVASGEVISLYADSHGEYGYTESLALDSASGRIIYGLTNVAKKEITETRSFNPETGTYDVLSAVPARFGFDDKGSVFYVLDDLLNNGIPGQAFAIDGFGLSTAVIARPE